MTEKLSAEFHKDRVEALCRRCPDGLIVLRGELDWSRKREIRALDPSYSESNFKQERHLYYLTGIEVPNSFVIIDPKTQEVLLYTDWTVERDLERVKSFGVVGEIRPPAAFLRDARDRGQAYGALYALYHPFPEAGRFAADTGAQPGALAGVFPPGMGEPVGEDMQFTQKLSALFPAHRIKNLYPAVRDMQRIKSSEEIRLLRKANEAVTAGVLEGIKSIRPGIHDRDVTAVIEYTMSRRGATRPVFAPNLMSGPNSVTMLSELFSDYGHRDRQLAAGDGIIIDIGTEVDYYLCSAVRTVPVAGRFTADQQRIYELYLDCYRRTLQGIRPGVSQRDLINLCAGAMEEALPSLRETYLRQTAEGFIRLNTTARSMLGHYVDMNVFGAGAQGDEPLEPGMIFILEPLLFCREKQFGVVIGDTVLVTEEGCEIWSGDLPYDIAEIERIMAEPSIFEELEAETARRNARVGTLPNAT